MPRADQASIAEAPLGASFGDEQRRADVLAFDPDGRNARVYATGIRNCSGLTVQPATGALWCAVNERDGLGDNLPPDYATRVAEGAFYGWPGTISAITKTRATRTSGRISLTTSRFPTSSFRRIQRRSASPSTREISFPRSTKATLSSRCTGRGIARRSPATRWFGS